MFDFNLFPVLQGENIVLREVSDQDRDAVFAMASDPEVTRYVQRNTHASPGDTNRALEDFRRGYEERTGIVWGIQLRETGELAGLIGIDRLDYRRSSAGVGYWLGAKYWGRGYASEALEKVVPFTLHALGFERIEARCAAENAASGRVMQKAGMTCEGTMRRSEFIKGRFWDLRIYSALQCEEARPGVIPVAFDGPLFESVRMIRREVFVTEQGVPYEEEFDRYDVASDHALAFFKGRPVGCGRFYVNGGSGVMGRVACLAEFRRKGVGAAVCRELIGLARYQGLSEIVIHAQTRAVPFYEKLGFETQGEAFSEVGIEHVRMCLKLAG